MLLNIVGFGGCARDWHSAFCVLLEPLAFISTGYQTNGKREGGEWEEGMIIAYDIRRNCEDKKKTFIAKIIEIVSKSNRFEFYFHFCRFVPWKPMRTGTLCKQILTTKQIFSNSLGLYSAQFEKNKSTIQSVAVFFIVFFCLLFGLSITKFSHMKKKINFRSSVCPRDDLTHNKHLHVDQHFAKRAMCDMRYWGLEFAKDQRGRQNCLCRHRPAMTNCHEEYI